MVTSSNLPYSKKHKETRDENVVFVHFINLFKSLSVSTDDNVPIGKCRVCHGTKPTFGKCLLITVWAHMSRSQKQKKIAYSSVQVSVPCF